jgi:tetratricopeptide (TPR) repeat protein
MGGALEDLREGIAIVGDRSDAARRYLPILARTLFCLSRFEEAAEAYKSIGEYLPVFRNPISGLQIDYDWELCFHHALCLKKAGRQEAAIRALIEFAENKTLQIPEPVNKAFQPDGIASWVAKWYSAQGRYRDATRFLKAELESRFSPPESWQLSTILVLDSVLQQGEGLASAARDYIGSRPDLTKLMSGITADLWPTFLVLSQESARHWLSAVYLRFAECPLENVRAVWLNSAVREYGWVLELELSLGFKNLIFARARSLGGRP